MYQSVVCVCCLFELTLFERAAITKAELVARALARWADDASLGRQRMPLF
jgi:hypothetical protein